MDQKKYYCVTTRRFTLRCDHEEWIKLTQDYYNKILLFYYQLYLSEEEKEPGSLTAFSDQKVLRKLEILTVAGRDKKPVPYPLPWEKVPLYFRRSAINGAAASAKVYLGRLNSGRYMGKTEAFQKGITFYKGMYKELTADSVTLKIWNGQSWVWKHCRLSGNHIPDQAETMSPSVLSGQQGIAFFLPVKSQVKDGRTVKERMQQGCKVCSVQFTNEDYFAVAVVMDAKGIQSSVHFFKGGKEYAHRCAEIVSKMQRAEKAMGWDKKEKLGNSFTPEEKVNKKFWMKLKNINEHYAHSISRQIIAHCSQHNAEVILLPKYDDKFTKYVTIKSGNWSPLHLSLAIRERIYYKAWMEGILVLEVASKDTSAFCALCGSPVKKKKDMFLCPNGHQGNKFINSARNIGLKCLKSFGHELAK